MMEPPLSLFPILLFSLILPSMAYRDGARIESCYDHAVMHSNPSIPIPINKIDCIGNCRYDLILDGRVDETTLAIIDEGVTLFECGSVYKCESCLIRNYVVAIVRAIKPDVRDIRYPISISLRAR